MILLLSPILSSCVHHFSCLSHPSGYLIQLMYFHFLVLSRHILVAVFLLKARVCFSCLCPSSGYLIQWMYSNYSFIFLSHPDVFLLLPFSCKPASTVSSASILLLAIPFQIIFFVSIFSCLILACSRCCLSLASLRPQCFLCLSIFSLSDPNRCVVFLDFPCLIFVYSCFCLDYVAPTRSLHRLSQHLTARSLSHLKGAHCSNKPIRAITPHQCTQFLTSSQGEGSSGSRRRKSQGLVQACNLRLQARLKLELSHFWR